MNKVNEIKAAVGRLPREQPVRFREWFSEFDAAAWDRELADDVAAGRDALADEALSYVRGGAEVSLEMQHPPEDTAERRATFDRARSAGFLVRQIVEQNRR
jgi:hypothetical protein